MPLKPNQNTELSDLYVAFAHAPLLALGPSIRVGIWLAGCKRRCPGCLSPELFEKKKELRKTPEEAAELVLSLFEANGAHGVTVSGGEPFERPLGLKKFLEIIKKNGVDDALIYSGYLASELLLSFPWLKELATALVDGPFKENEPSKEIFRGSMGQTLTVFDPRKKDLYEDWSKQTKRKAQFVLVGREIRVLGVPARGELEKAFAKALDPEKPLIFK